MVAQRRRDAVVDLGEAPLAELTGAGIAVPVAGGGAVAYTNLDYAASAPSLARVSERVAEVLPFYSSVHRGTGYLSQLCTALYEEARVRLHAWLGAREDDTLIFTRNTTDALNLLARTVPQEVEVLYLDIEHHADLLPWQQRPSRCLESGATIEETLERMAGALELGRTGLVAITGASNVTGEVPPIARVAELAHRYGARLAVDAAQLAPHRAIDMGLLGIDYLALSGHKCYAPFGAGVLVGARDWLDAAPPYLAGGGAVERVTIERTRWAPSPQRHEGGTPNLFGAIALATASEVLGELAATGLLEGHEGALRDQLVQGLESLEGVRTLRIWAETTEVVGVVSFEVLGHEPELVGAYLAAEHGIGVRSGRFCAHPLLDRLGVSAGAVRASLGLGSTTGDVTRLLDALAAYLERGPAHVPLTP